MKPIITLEENDLWRISMIDGDTDIVTVSISSSPRIGEPFAHEEFIGSASRDGKAIFLIDKTSSFGNRLDWPHIIELLTPHLEDKDVRAIGFCMGGFLAVVLSKYFNIHSVVAITPQYGVSPDYFPNGECSWFTELYTDKIDTFHIPDLDGYFQDHTNYYIFNSEGDIDQLQIPHFPTQDNVFIFEFGEDYDHQLPGQLDRDLPILAYACFDHEPWVVSEFIEDHYAE